MAKGDIISLFGTVTQGAADAFVQGQINTGLSVASKDAYLIKAITLEFVTTALSTTDQSNYEIALSRVSKAAMPNTYDNDVLYKWKRATRLTTSGALVQDLVVVIVPDNEIKVIEGIIYLDFDSNATGGVNQLVVRIDCELTTVSDAERISILQNSLT